MGIASHWTRQGAKRLVTAQADKVCLVWLTFYANRTCSPPAMGNERWRGGILMRARMSIMEESINSSPCPNPGFVDGWEW